MSRTGATCKLMGSAAHLGSTTYGYGFKNCETSVKGGLKNFLCKRFPEFPGGGIKIANDKLS